MTKPWEEYGTPWTEYSSTEVAVQPTNLDEAPEGHRSNPVDTNPHISNADRLLYKNLGNKDAIQWLQGKYPNLAIEKDENGEIIYQDRAAGTWHKMDPGLGGGEGALGKIGEVALDVGDFTADAIAGALETLGMLGGGFGGLVASGATGPAAPVTAIPLVAGGAAGGAGFAGYTAEGIRQGLGVMTGVNKELDKEAMQDAALWAGGMTLLPFSNNIPNSARKSAMKDLGQTSFEIANNPVTGLWNNAMDFVSPILGGTNRQLRRQGRKYADDVYRMKNEADEIAENTGTTARPIERESEKLRTAASQEIDAWQKDVGQAIDQKIKTPGVTYDFSAVEMDIARRIGELKAKDTRSEAENQLLKALTRLDRELFTEKFTRKLTQEEKEAIRLLGVKEPPERIRIDSSAVSGAKAAEMKDVAFKKGHSLSPTATAVDKEEYRLAKSTYGDLAARIDQTLQEQTGEGLAGLNESYMKILDHKDALDSAGLYKHSRVTDSSDIQRGARAASTIDSQAKINANMALEGIDVSRGTDLLEHAREIEAGRNWIPGHIPGYGPNPNPFGGSYAGPFMMSMGAGGLGYATDNPWLGAVAMGGGLAGKAMMSPAATEKYLRMGAAARSFNDRLYYAPEAVKRGLLHEINPWMGHGGE